MFKNHVGYFQKLSSAVHDFMLRINIVASEKSCKWRRDVNLSCIDLILNWVVFVFVRCKTIIFTKWGVVTTNFTIWINWKSVSILRIRIVYFGWGGVPYFVTCLNIELMWLSLPTIFSLFFQPSFTRNRRVTITQISWKWWKTWLKRPKSSYFELLCV